MMRALAVIRLSVLTDETTSPGRQRCGCKDAARFADAAIVDEALDLDVSASKTSPFDRPELGARLAAPDGFDVIVAWRFDRLIRNMQDMSDLAKWAAEHKKMIVFNEGPGGRMKLDFRNPLDPLTHLLLMIFAFAAQLESQSIRDRVTGAQAALRGMALRWRGGRPPYGYKPVKLPGGGYTLVPDDVAVHVLERMIAMTKDGESLTQIAFALQRDGVATPRNRILQLRDKECNNAQSWNARTVAHILSSPALLGHKTFRGATVRNAEGEPVQFTQEPVLSREEWDALQGDVAKRSAMPVQRRDSTGAMLTGVVHCACCKGRMYWTERKGRFASYKCGARQRGVVCKAPAGVRGDWLDEWSSAEFLRRLGGVRVHEVRQIPGSDPRPEIEEVTAELERHYAAQGTQRSEAARRAWERHAEALDARLAALEALPVVESHEERVEGSESYADAWQAADTAGRGEMLRDAGCVVWVSRGASGGYRSLDTGRVAFEITDEFFAAAAVEALAVEEIEDHLGAASPPR